MRYLAHIAEDGREQTVAEHLLGTAKLAGEFAACFGGEADAKFAGAAHDLGKCTPEFQTRLHGGAIVDHATAGATFAFSRKNLPAALAVAGHHGGIPDLGHPGDGPEESTLFGRMKRSCSFDTAIWDEVPLPAPCAPSWLGTGYLQNDFYTRMLYSCLVDADFQDTESFMNGTPAPRGGCAGIGELLRRMRVHAAEYLANEEAKEIFRTRNAVLRACMDRGRAWEQGLYTLTVPTGGGKTFSSLAFALEHAAARGLGRVIYVIPYLSIIEQTADAFSEILGAENVLAHYSGADYQLAEPEEMTPDQHRKLLASENWDAPVIVTTAVQFFESLYANRSSRCRKLHNIANSVVIFDEAQTLPNDYLLPCLSAIAQLVQFYHTTAVLCTATQPAIAPLLQTLAPALTPREICPDYGVLFQLLRRTTIRDLGEITQDELAQRLCEQKQVLCVVNRRSTAQALYDVLPPGGSFCLTTLLCGLDRRSQIAEIRQRLKLGLPCRVVSTSLIEAGVDVDFPTALREDCSLDSLLQTAGRCNREGKHSAAESIVYRFRLKGMQPPHMLAKNLSAFSYAARKYSDLSSPEAIKAYFSDLFQLKGKALDKKEILAAIQTGIDGCALPFSQIAERFHLIEAPTRTVYLPIDDGAALCSRLRNGEMNRVLLRMLGIYSVDCYEAQFRALEDAGALELLPDGAAILTDLSKYSRKTGLAGSIETGIGIFL